LTEAHPKIEVSILVDQARKSPIETGADLNIRMGTQPSNDFEAVLLMNERIFPVMSPVLWEKLGRPTKTDELLDLPLLHDRDPSTSWGTWRKQYGPALLNVRQGPRLTSSDLILRAAEQGQGVALARGRLTGESLANGSLIRPLGDAELDLGDNYWIIANPETGGRRVVRTVIAWLLSEAQMGCEKVVVQSAQ